MISAISVVNMTKPLSSFNKREGSFLVFAVMALLITHSTD
jgi:hypothetical protein